MDNTSTNTNQPDADDPELAALSAEEADLLRRITELRNKKNIVIESRKGPFIITVAGISGYAPNQYVVINAKYRKDVIELMRQPEYKRRYISGDRNEFPLDCWPAFRDAVINLPAVELKYANDSVEKLIQNMLRTVQYEISRDGRWISIAIGERGSLYYFQAIPTYRRHPDSKLINTYVINANEAWRIAPYLESLGDKIEITEDARGFIIEEVNRRLELASIKENWEGVEFPVESFEKNNLKLKSYQAAAIKFVNRAGNRALLHLEMGLGKTPTSLAISEHHKFKRNLIVCPASVIVNWQREIKKFTGEDTFVLRGENPDEYSLTYLLTKRPRYVLVSYDTISVTKDVETQTTDDKGIVHVEKSKLRAWVEFLNTLYQPTMITFDEIHYTKNSDSNRSRACRELKSPYVLGLSGTPLTNKPQDLWPVLYILDRELFPNESDFENRYLGGSRSFRNTEELKDVMSRYMISYTKKDVMKDLKPIERISKYFTLPPRFQKAHDKIMAGLTDQLLTGSMSSQETLRFVLVRIQRAKQICAMAKYDYVAELATELYDSADNAGDKWKKVIIFTQYTDMPAATKEITKRLGQEAISFTGKNSPEERQRIVDRFQTDPDIHFLVASTKAAAEGLNITAAGNVIFNDLLWTPAAHQQAEGRAYGRVSDLHSIGSYYIVSPNTIEEMINDILMQKMNMISSVMEGDVNMNSTSIINELLSKLKGKR